MYPTKAIIPATTFLFEKKELNNSHNGWRTAIWAVLDKFDQDGADSEDAIAAAEALLRDVEPNFEHWRADFENSVRSYRPGKANHAGALIKRAKDAGWKPPTLEGHEALEVLERRLDRALGEGELKVESTYFVGHKKLWSPINSYSLGDETFVRLSNFNTDFDGVALWHVYRNDAGDWKKGYCRGTRGLTSGGFWTNIPDWHSFNRNTGEETWFERHEHTSAAGFSFSGYRTTELYVSESISNCLAEEAAFRGGGRSGLVDSFEVGFISAMSAMNLRNVVADIIRIRPDMKITVVADREASGDGMRLATAVCREFPAVRLADPFPNGELGDVDDLYKQKGAEAVLECLDRAAVVVMGEQVDGAEGGGDGLAAEPKRRGRPPGSKNSSPRARGRSSYSEIFEVLKAERWGFVPRLDRFGGQLVLTDGDGQTRPVDDDATMDAVIYGERAGLRSVGPREMAEVIRRIGSANAFDAAIEWLENLQWDGKPRVDEFFAKYAGAEATEYARTCGRYLWSALAGRVLSPGVKADMVAVLVGAQGARKSSLIEALAPCADWVCEIDFSMSDSELIRKTSGKVVIELPELRGLRGRAQEHVKAILSQRIDRVRPLYAQNYEDRPRRWIALGSTNEQEFLTDETGHRRWLPIRVGECDPEGVGAVREQLWAEGAELFRTGGVQFSEAERLARGTHDEFVEREAWEGPVADFMKLNPASETADIAFGALRIETKDITRSVEMRLAKILQTLGYTNKRRRGTTGARVRVWTY